MSEAKCASATDWLELLQRERVQLAILDPRTDRDWVEILRSQPEWTVDFDDGDTVILSAAPPWLESQRQVKRPSR